MSLFMHSNAYGKGPQSIECFFESSKNKQKQSLKKVFQHLLFHKNNFEHQPKVKTKQTKTIFLKKFSYKGARKEPEGSQRVPKGNQRSRKSSKIML